MEQVEEEGTAMAKVFEQKLQHINNQFQNPNADQTGLEIEVQRLNQCLNNLWEAGGPENLKKSATAPFQISINLNSNGTREAQLVKVDEAEKVTIPSTEDAEEDELSNIEIVSVHGSDDADPSINFEDVDDHDSDVLPPPSQQHIPSVSQCLGTEEMSSISTEEPTVAAQVIKQENRSVRHNFDQESALRSIFSCLCGKKCPNIRSLSGHINYFNKERNFQCDFCGSHFPSLAPLVYHLKVFHQDKSIGEVEPQATIKVEWQRYPKRLRKKPNRYSQI